MRDVCAERENVSVPLLLGHYEESFFSDHMLLVKKDLVMK
jgi:hypothetical protein